MCKPSFMQIAEILWFCSFNAVKAASCPNRKDQQRGSWLSGLQVFLVLWWRIDCVFLYSSHCRWSQLHVTWCLFSVHATEYTLINLRGRHATVCLCNQGILPQNWSPSGSLDLELSKSSTSKEEPQSPLLRLSLRWNESDNRAASGNCGERMRLSTGG